MYGCKKHKQSMVIICHNCTFCNVSARRQVTGTCEVDHRLTNVVASVLPRNEILIYMSPQITDFKMTECNFIIKKLS